MSHFINRLFTSSVFAFLFASTAATASAQQARFHLPFEARWGSLVLPPGDYTVQLPRPSEGRPEVLVEGPAAGFVMPESRDDYGARGPAPSAKEYLELTKVGDVYFVTKYQDGLEATTFYFKMPQQAGPENTAPSTVSQ